MVKYVYQHNYEGRPQPTTAHRFEIQRDENIRQRLDFVRKGLTETKIAIPEIIGVTLYGSYTKGTALEEESDVDYYLFIDADSALIANPDAEIETLKKFNRGEFYLISRFHQPIANGYTKSFFEHIFSIMDLEETSLNLKMQAHPIPISHAIIDAHIQEVVNHLRELADLDRQNTNSIPVVVGPNIPAVFHLQIGRSLNTYRKYLIDKLVQLEQDESLGEKIWKMIVSEVKRYEMLSIKIEKRFPETLEHARAIYCRDKTT